MKGGSEKKGMGRTAGDVRGVHNLRERLTLSVAASVMRSNCPNVTRLTTRRQTRGAGDEREGDEREGDARQEYQRSGMRVGGRVGGMDELEMN